VDTLKRFVAKEHRLDDVSTGIRDWVRSLNPSSVGAHQINCSDECERECVDSFHNLVVRPLLPALKYWTSSSFRTVNLGGRYETGSVGIAEEHYTTKEAAQGFKVLVVKLNAHVSVHNDPGEPTIFGQMNRYQTQSVYCGALHALLEGAPGAFVDELRDSFQRGMDRLSMLRDPEQVDPTIRALFTAITSAQLQAVRAMTDVLAHESHCPTVYLILPSVTLNRRDDDTEIVVGLHMIDERHSTRTHEYVGLGADPSRYVLDHFAGRIHVTES
jgi:hypothetical protein